MIFTPAPLIFVPLVVVAVLNIYIGYRVVAKDKKSLLRLSFFFLCIFVSLWAIFISLMSIGISSNFMSFNFKAAGWAGAFIPLFLLIFSAVFPQDKMPFNKITLALIFISAATMIVLSPTDLLLNNKSIGTNEISMSLGPIALPYLLYFLVYFTWAGKILYERLKAEKGQLKTQFKYFFSGLFIATIFGFLCNVVFVYFGVGNFVYLGPLGTVFLVGLTGYAINKQHLFDIDLAFHYGFIATAGALAGAGTTAVILFGARSFWPAIFPISNWAITIASILAAFFIFSSKFILEAAYNFSNEYILRHKYDYLKDMPSRIVEWPKIMHPGKLKLVVEKDFLEAMKFETAKVYLSGEWAIGTHKAAKFFYDINPDNLDEETERKISKDDPLVQYAEEQENIIFIGELKKEFNRKEIPEEIKKAVQNIIELMRQQSLEVIVPFFTIEHRPKYLLGVVFLGRWFYKDREAAVDIKDLGFFQKLAGAVGVAFSHSLKNRFMEIAGERKDDVIKDSIAEIKKLDKEKTEVEKEMEAVKAKASRFMKMASEFATKIQVINEKQEEFDAIMRHVESGVLTIREGLVKTTNHQARVYLADTGRSAEGRPFEEIFTDQFKNTLQIIEDIKKTIKTGQPVTTFETAWVKGNKGMPVEIKIFPLRDIFELEKINGALVEIIDIFEAKEKAKLANEKKNLETYRDLFEGLRHELNNAMNILNNYSYAFKNFGDHILSQEDFKKDFVEVIPQVVKFVSKLIDDMATAHSPMELGDAVWLDFNAAVENVLQEFTPRFKESKITIERKFSILPKIEAVPDHLRTVFYQLIKNSLEAIEEYDYQRQEGQKEKIGGTISISTGVNEAGEIEATISDNGIGIEEINLDKVLNPFFTTKVHSVAHQETGTGLGLNQVYNIVQLYKGGFKIASQFRVGTTVVISFKKEIEKETKEAANVADNSL